MQRGRQSLSRQSRFERANQRHLLHRWADYLESEYEGVDFRALSIGGEPPLDVEPRPAGITNNGQKVVR